MARLQITGRLNEFFTLSVKLLTNLLKFSQLAQNPEQQKTPQGELRR
jgi:hypothetical protein